MKYLEENLEAAKVQLSSEELSDIRQIINSIEIIGDRYTASGMQVRNNILYNVGPFDLNKIILI